MHGKSWLNDKVDPRRGMGLAFGRYCALFSLGELCLCGPDKMCEVKQGPIYARQVQQVFILSNSISLLKSEVEGLGHSWRQSAC